MLQAVWEHRILLFSIGCHGVLLWRLASESLAGIYPFLTLFLAAEMAQNVAFVPLRPDSNAYASTYFYSTPVLWVLAYLVVLELYRLILEDYPGISSVGRKAVSWCMGLAVIVSAATAIPDLKSAGRQFPILHIFNVVERSTVLGLLLFLVLIQVFLFRYRLQLPRNRIVYAAGYALYFGIGVAQGILLTALGIPIVVTSDQWVISVAGLLLLAGTVLLSRAGEVRVKPESDDDSSDRAHLHEQLAGINKMLSRAARGRG
jgi:hypothetical protein